MAVTAARMWSLLLVSMWISSSNQQDATGDFASITTPPPDNEHHDEDYDDYMDYAEFVEHDMDSQFYEREFTFLVPKGSLKTEFFVEMDKGMKLDLSAQVLTVQEANGRPIPLTVTVKDIGKRVVSMGQDREGKIVNVEHAVQESGVYEVVFHLIDYHTDDKSLWVELSIEGKTDVREIDKKFRLKREKKYKLVHDNLISSMKMVQKNQMAAFRHQLAKGHNTRRTQSRVEALAGMIDKWSIIHVIVVLVVMVAQVFVLKGFFELPSSSSKI